MTEKKKRGRGRPKGSRKGGQPPKLTAEVTEAICESLREGNYIETAAVLAGVSKPSVYNWLKEGHKARAALEKDCVITAHQRQCIVFLDAIKKAEAEAERDALAALRLHGPAAWQSIAWRLERRHPDRWGRRQLIEHSSPPDKPVRVQRLKIGDDEIEF